MLEDRSGLPLRATRAQDGSRGGWTPVAEVDPRLVQAFVSAEDHRFFAHRGVDVRSVGRALRQPARHAALGRVHAVDADGAAAAAAGPESGGGSCARRCGALRLEAHLSKRTILEQYLNRVPLWPQGLVGVSAASRLLYFGASARGEVELGQAALLAGVARSPSRDNPLVSPRRARARRATWSWADVGAGVSKTNG